MRAGNETRTRDPNLGKVVLYQLSYSRMTSYNYTVFVFFLQHFSGKIGCQLPGKSLSISCKLSVTSAGNFFT